MSNAVIYSKPSCPRYIRAKSSVPTGRVCRGV